VHPFREPASPSRPCPRCAIGLGTRQVLDVRLDECADCGGVFVPGELVPRLLDPLDLGLEVVEVFPRGVPAPEDPIRYLRCPRCQAMMNRRLLMRGSNVVVDQCKPHGVWFDAHELRRLAELAADRPAAVAGSPAASAPAAAPDPRPVVAASLERRSLLERAIDALLGWL
jgi:Zn-finger nucleic acid-binding protein